MIYRQWLVEITIIIAICFSIISLGDRSALAQEQLKFDKSKLPDDGSKFPKEVLETADILKEYYKKSNMQSIWLSTDRMPQLIARMRAAKLDGLRPGDYPIKKLASLYEVVDYVVDNESRAIIEAWFSAYFLKYTSDLKLGRFKPRKINPGLHWRKKVIDKVAALESLSKANSLNAFFEKWEPQNPAYISLKRFLSLHYKIKENGGWPIVSMGEPLKPGENSPRIIEVRARLTITDKLGNENGIDEKSIYGSSLVDSVKRFQRRHLLEEDGVIGKATLEAMNVSVDQRIRQIIISMERWRWMPEDYGTHFIAVNIASYQLFYIRDMKVIDKMRVVVGLPYHKTPVFSDEIDHLVLNPYWNVPFSIATKEMLPKLKANSASVSASGFEVVKDGAVIDPASINWSAYSRKNFPYRLRQRPGQKNALGRIKFMFPNRFNVYMHDTPAQSKFKKAARAFSHGCVRVRRPIDLAVEVLKDTKGWSKERIMGVLSTGKRTVVRLAKPLKVHIVYSTAWPGGKDEIYFGKDIYKRDEKLYKVLEN